jgi:hypothetical protein
VGRWHVSLVLHSCSALRQCLRLRLRLNESNQNVKMS